MRPRSIGRGNGHPSHDCHSLFLTSTLVVLGTVAVGVGLLTASKTVPVRTVPSGIVASPLETSTTLSQTASAAPNVVEVVDPLPRHHSKADDRHHCHISSHSSDGLGHQIEAKYSCIATALLLTNCTYIHMPVSRMEHDTQSHFAAIEKFFGLDQYFPVFDPQTMQRVNVSRKVWACPPRFQDYQGSDEYAWTAAATETSPPNHPCPFPRPRLGPTVDTSKLLVYTLDSCWDIWYCHPGPSGGHTEQTWKLEVQPRLRAAYWNDPATKKLTSAQHEDLTHPYNVVVHMRRTDSAHPTHTRVFAQLVQTLWTQYQQQQIQKSTTATPTIQHSLRISIHTDASSTWDLWLEMQQHGLEIPVTMVRWYNEENATQLQALHHMVQSRILVASASSLSHTAGLLTHGLVVYPHALRPNTQRLLGWYPMVPQHVFSDKPN